MSFLDKFRSNRALAKPLILATAASFDLSVEASKDALIASVNGLNYTEKQEMLQAFVSSNDPELRQFAREMILTRELAPTQSYGDELREAGFAQRGESDIANVIIERAERESGAELKTGYTKQYSPEDYDNEGSIDQRESGAIRKLASAVKAGGISEEEQAILSDIAEIMGTASVTGDNLSSNTNIQDKIGELTALPENAENKEKIEGVIH